MQLMPIREPFRAVLEESFAVAAGQEFMVGDRWGQWVSVLRCISKHYVDLC